MAKFIIDNPKEFVLRVGLLHIEDYVQMGIRPEFTSMFQEWEMEGVHAFVKMHPEYHIVSVFPGLMLNRFVSHTNRWMLADGDPDPELIKVITRRFWQKAKRDIEASQPRSFAKLT